MLVRDQDFYARTVATGAFHLEHVSRLNFYTHVRDRMDAFVRSCRI